ncbi:hypothetical protein POX_h09657 [Penicillium oxalicum]|uniref:Uncharacterized protein n=1 Tax=Penicillium oxalicum (strain 114-2 / CGMCC 5302) TaxID=933388 RepID=S7ZL81_PENO1|nr:hypothetical protein POX_h09657 [Penicillium oxalicum]EPS31370.1 hypothetical protein PDE_06325 [Penicillium oxalicum 114-2]KAI2785895.1 hypothetical protein POX_h09657 [Penicillium oxalicum]
MRFNTITLLAGAATAVAASNTANLLLPGFQGRNLEAGIVTKAGDATTYLVTCPTSVASADCGIPGKGMTVVAAPTSAEIIQSYPNGDIALVSCSVDGTTFASCSASQGTLTVEKTLAAKDINWMAVTVTGDCSTSTPTPTAIPTITATVATETSTSTSLSTSSTWSATWSASSTPVKSPSRSASSTLVSSTPLVPSQTGVTATEPAATASATLPAALNGAASLAGNGWALGGAVMALVFALA